MAEVDASRRRQAEYSTDASLHRVPPELAVFPRDADEVVATVETCLLEDLQAATRPHGLRFGPTRPPTAAAPSAA